LLKTSPLTSTRDVIFSEFGLLPADPTPPSKQAVQGFQQAPQLLQLLHEHHCRFLLVGCLARRLHDPAWRWVATMKGASIVSVVGAAVVALIASRHHAADSITWWSVNRVAAVARSSRCVPNHIDVLIVLPHTQTPTTASAFTSVVAAVHAAQTSLSSSHPNHLLHASVGTLSPVVDDIEGGPPASDPPSDADTHAWQPAVVGIAPLTAASVAVASSDRRAPPPNSCLATDVTRALAQLYDTLPPSPRNTSASTPWRGWNRLSNRSIVIFIAPDAGADHDRSESSAGTAAAQAASSSSATAEPTASTPVTPPRRPAAVRHKRAQAINARLADDEGVVDSTRQHRFDTSVVLVSAPAAAQSASGAHDHNHDHDHDHDQDADADACAGVAVGNPSCADVYRDLSNFNVEMTLQCLMQSSDRVNPDNQGSSSPQAELLRRGLDARVHTITDALGDDGGGAPLARILIHTALDIRHDTCLDTDPGASTSATIAKMMPCATGGSSAWGLLSSPLPSPTVQRVTPESSASFVTETIDKGEPVILTGTDVANWSFFSTHTTVHSVVAAMATAMKNLNAGVYQPLSVLRA
jgi:hypothetical protein